MLVSKIAMIGSRDVPLENYQGYFANTDQTRIAVPSLSQLTYSIVNQNDSEYYGAFSAGTLIAILEVNADRNNQSQISLAQTQQDYRNQGVLRYLVNLALDRHGALLSDSQQTTEARKFWEALISIPGPGNSVSVVDPINQSETPAREVPPVEIWNDKEVPLLKIYRQAVTEEYSKYQQVNENWRNKRGYSQATEFYRPFREDLGQYNP